MNKTIGGRTIWRNMALICTIAMPLVLGTGTGYAAQSAAEVTETDVTLHKYMTKNTTFSGNNYYWGNGTTGTNNPFTAQNSEWEKVGEGYSFTAYKLNPDVITITNSDDVTISNTEVPELGLKWSDLLTVAQVARQVTRNQQIHLNTSATTLLS